MKMRKLGNLEVSAIGLGCWGMSGPYGQGDRKESLMTIREAIEIGIDFIDTADVYGNGHNEELVGEATRDIRNKIVLATKFGYRGNENGEQYVCGTPEYARQACEASLKRLGTDHIDLWYLHRLDKSVPVEETVGAMADMVREGKVLHIGLSEISASTLEKANREFPVTALQSEYSLFSRDIEADILPACRKLGIGFVPFSPLSRGILGGGFKSGTKFGKEDFRSNLPRFTGDNFDKNIEVAGILDSIAAKYNATPAQVALAWLLGKWEGIVPIPGMKRRKYLSENLGSVSLSLDEEATEVLESLAPMVSGVRYSARAAGFIDRS